MSHVDFIRSYLDRFCSDKARHSEVRTLLTDDFTFRDPRPFFAGERGES